MEIDRLPNEIAPWRESPFTPGIVYRVRNAFAANSSVFEAGELLTFVRDAWSRYDGMTGYFFHGSQGYARRWDISDDDDIARWRNVFEPITGSSA